MMHQILCDQYFFVCISEKVPKISSALIFMLCDLNNEKVFLTLLSFLQTQILLQKLLFGVLRLIDSEYYYWNCYVIK